MSRQAKFRFQLYVAGDAANSMQAIANLNLICRMHLLGKHEIEIVDVFQNPKRALEEGVFMTPTLVKIAPAPVRRIVGTLSEPQIVLSTLGLEIVAA